ncbi:MAG: hypothetical protein N4A74_02005, partial [Carboxylicivirga sp.]|nr:hypothetical protein [Carboxylicivirga sp.]
YKGLLGIEILEPGMKRIRIQPNLPKEWKNLKAKLPTPNGYFVINVDKGQLQIGVFDESIAEVEVDEKVKVHGAKALPISQSKSIEPVKDAIAKVPAIKERKAAVFFEKGLPYTNRHLDFPKISLKEFSNLEASGYDAIIITNNALPAFTAQGRPISEILESYVEKGGAVIFYGATMKTRNGYYAIKMGLQGGVIEWYKKEKDKWLPYNPKSNKTLDKAMRGGTVYWGEGHYFHSWDVQQGMFGFSANGKGILSEIESIQNEDAQINEVFSDFAISKPFYFQSLADTQTNFNFMYPQKGERFSCFCRIVNTKTKGEYILISESLVKNISSSTINEVLAID